jgi:hypothetical protein
MRTWLKVAIGIGGFMAIVYTANASWVWGDRAGSA